MSPTLVKIGTRDTRLILVFPDETTEVRDFPSIEECYAHLRELKATLPTFWIRDVLTQREYRSK